MNLIITGIVGPFSVLMFAFFFKLFIQGIMLEILNIVLSQVEQSEREEQETKPVKPTKIVMRIDYRMVISILIAGIFAFVSAIGGGIWLVNILTPQ